MKREPRGESWSWEVSRFECTDGRLVVYSDEHGVGDQLLDTADFPVLELNPPHAPRLRVHEKDQTYAMAEVMFTRVIVRSACIDLELSPDAGDATRYRIVYLSSREPQPIAAELGAALAQCLPAGVVADAAIHAARAAERLPAPSPRERALLAAVITAPDDDAPRRVLADHWLALDDPRGELIALQCEDCADPGRRRAIDRRVVELLDTHQATWLAPYDLTGESVSWTRGFVEHVDANAQRLLGAWPQLITSMPLRRVSIWPYDVPDLAALLARSWPPAVTKLALYDFRDTVHMDLLIASPVLAQIESLYCSTPDVSYDAAHLDGLVANGRLLRELTVRRADFTAPALARTLAARSWRILNLPYCGFDAAAAEVFAAATNQVELIELQLGGNPLGDDGVVALARGPGLVALRDLSLYRTGVGPRGIKALAACRALRVLSLDDNNLDAAGAKALAKLPSGQLLELSLDDNPLGNDGAHMLAKSAALAGLETLSARNLRLSDVGAHALLVATHGALTELDLEGNHIGPSVRFVHAPELATLQTLRLSKNGFDPAAVEVLAKRTDLNALRVLDLSRNPIGPRGALALAVAPGLGALEELHVLSCGIDEAGRAALIARFGERVAV